MSALLWDVPYISSHATPDAARFLDAFRRRLPLGAIESPTSPLDLAAAGVAADLQGEHGRATPLYEELSRRSGEARLLGLFLLAWSPGAADESSLNAALAATELLQDDPLLQARLCSKLIAAAYGHKWDDALPELFTRALDWAPAGSMLSTWLQVERYNLLGGAWPAQWHTDSDELTGYEWIRQLAASATAKTLTGEVVARVRSPWTITIGGGPSEADDVVAALVQAEWAGAIWLRREISQQLAAHLLLDESGSPEWTAAGVSLWAANASGIRNLDGVVALTEPRFDGGSADRIVSELDRGEPLRPRTDSVLIEAASALWDLVSENTMAYLLERLLLKESELPDDMAAASVWALAALRIPQVWERKFRRLDDSQRRQLLRVIGPGVVARIPVTVARELLEAGDISAGLPNAQVLAALARRVEVFEGFSLAAAPPAAIVMIAEQRLSLVDGELLESATRQLISEATTVVDSARRGTRGLGGYEPLELLSRALVFQRGSAQADGLRLIADVSLDPEVPADIRYDAIRGLTRIAYNSGLPRELAERLSSIPEVGVAALLDYVTPKSMHAAKVALLVISGRDASDSELLTLAHDESPNVRRIAFEAVALALRDRTSETLEGALLGALFDPDQNIVRDGVGALSAISLQTAAVRLAVADRLSTLFEKGGRTVRAAVVEAVQAGSITEGKRSRAATLLDEARQDRSYQVRNAARVVR